MVTILEVTNRKLLLAKQIFKHGLEHAEKDSTLNRMLAIHHFHMAVDIVINTIIYKHNISTGQGARNLHFNDKINLIRRHFRDIPFPNENNIINLNHQRNNVQHDATSPDFNTVRDYLEYTKSFLKDSFLYYFWQEYEDISEISLIEEDLLRSLFEKANLFIKNKEYKRSLRCISVAFLLSAKSINLDSFLLLRRSSNLDVHDHFNVDNIEMNFFYLEYGLNKEDFKKFSYLTPHSFFHVGGGITISNKYGIIWKPTVDDANWALDFLIKLILKWQNKGLKPQVPEKFLDYASNIENVCTNFDNQ